MDIHGLLYPTIAILQDIKRRVIKEKEIGYDVEEVLIPFDRDKMLKSIDESSMPDKDTINMFVSRRWFNKIAKCNLLLCLNFIYVLTIQYQLKKITGMVIPIRKYYV